jgi:predicted lysophospholipase L1 biosynthesis ABC-type transport system permease subunit
LHSYGGAPQGDDAPLRSVLLEADDIQALPSLRQEVAALGLHVDDHAQEVADLLSAGVAVLALFGLLGLMLTGVAMVYAFGGYVEARGRELALVRTVGATPGFVLTWMLLEALGLGLLAGGLGTAVAATCVYGGPKLWGPALAQVPLLPKPLLLMPWPLGAAAVAVTALTAVLGALGPAWRGARSPLSDPTHPG